MSTTKGVACLFRAVNCYGETVATAHVVSEDYTSALEEFMSNASQLQAVRMTADLDFAIPQKRGLLLC